MVNFANNKRGYPYCVVIYKPSYGMNTGAQTSLAAKRKCLLLSLYIMLLAVLALMFSGSIACLKTCSHDVVSKNSNANHLYAGDNFISPISHAAVSI